MSNKEEYEKILEIVDVNQYSGEKEFVDNCATKFKNVRNAFYIVLFTELFYLMIKDIFIDENIFLSLIILSLTLVVILSYLKQRKILYRELNTYLFRECYPDKGLSRYVNFIPMMLKKQILWSKVHYNMGIGLYYMGDITRASKMLSLMQDSCTTANDMILALYLKQLIALYYMDMDEVIGCANDARILHPKASQASYVQKAYSDIQTYGDYANYYINHDMEHIYQLFGSAYERPLDEVKRHFYLYKAAKECNDLQNINTFSGFVSANAGTTWYGSAITDGFVPVVKPDNYPAFIADQDRLNNPSKIDNSRKKYILLGVVAVLIMYLISYTIKTFNL
ncbi:hypothetical protein SAMN04487770_10217 [Butyrivibrio sp. ob235]|uniref:hypothetical protein n=1 Tax=Butyrivibrio sp. ob235 TaxID=1761780 RepID=UPI0008BC0840|nr:hypothetical protein [Butyrivibrio sp. ob235]SEK58076.1 hypothetical protein SAMN04487770_10217 [Butyrivibrio sp. ob235]